ncbi:ABC transporter permease [Bacillus cereus]|nr:ABC transporter permease [Bacillus cereus]
MLIKQLKLQIDYHYKAIFVFWALVFSIQSLPNFKHIKDIRIGFLQDVINNPSIAIIFFIVVSTFFIQLDLFHLAVSFGTTRLQFFIGSSCYIVLQSAFFSLLQIIFLRGLFYHTESTSLLGGAIEQFFVQFLLYVTVASLFQGIVIFQQRFHWIGCGVGSIFFIGLTSVCYNTGIKITFTQIEVLMNIPSFIIISIGLIILYFLVSGIFIRKISLEQMV